MANIIVEQVSIFPKTAARVAAAFLILTSVQLTPATDVRRLPQAKVFGEPEVFAQAQKGSNVVILTQYAPYQAGMDKRAPQAKFFGEPEVFSAPQRGNLLVIETAAVPYNQATDARRYQKAFFGEPDEPRFYGQRFSQLVLNTAPAAPTSGDILLGQDTYGWPPIEDVWAPAQRPSAVILNGFTTYNSALDVRRAPQAKFFGEPEVFAQAQRLYSLVDDTAAYNPRTDVRLLRAQARVFGEPEVFLKAQGGLSLAVNFTPYVPGNDVRRAVQAKAFADPEIFSRSAPFNALIVNGAAAPPAAPALQFAHGIDIYDYLNGSVLLAWGAFSPHADSYNIYVNGVLYANTAGLQIVVAGLTQPSYSAGAIAPATGNSLRPQNMPPAGVASPAGVYRIKVVAVSVGQERGAIEKKMSPSPTSIALITPMKRLWPFPNSGID